MFNLYLLNRGFYHKNSHFSMLMPNKNPIMPVMSNKMTDAKTIP
ncbi:hypothetical protein AO369_1152 [Moraxella catarrhalis]|nr:hypothetical protein AO369_1152 [Moraxella catarrhalis]